MTRGARRGARGSTLIEVMVATTVLVIAGLGFAGTSQYAATATGIGHRRTVGAFVRGELVDRLSVVPRSVLRTIADANEDTWIVDACYDVDAQRTEANVAYAAPFACDEALQPFYRSWIRIVDNGADAWAATTNTWMIGVYAERIDQPCEPEQRDAAVGCVSADLLLTD